MEMTQLDKSLVERLVIKEDPRVFELAIEAVLELLDGGSCVVDLAVADEHDHHGVSAQRGR